MNAQQVLRQISDYCRRTGLAESTFGRRAVNDGKLAARLRGGGRITTDTLDRIHAFIAENPASGRSPIGEPANHAQPEAAAAAPSLAPDMTALPQLAAVTAAKPDGPARNFRFFDNRQKYLLFV